MIVFGGRGILLDVEGTTSSIAFVYDVLFTHARRHVAGFVESHRDEAAVREAVDLLARTAGTTVDLDTAEGRSRATLAALDLMDRDVKDTGLKLLQGMIWRHGFEGGDLVAHVYDDVPPALAAWNDSGIDVRIYSSGSVEAQKLFFGHTAAGDLTPLLRGHYDTTTGPKREPASYSAIAADMGLAPREILFLSDVGAELDAARAAGMATGLAIRPGNRDPGGVFAHDPLHSFAEIVT